MNFALVGSLLVLQTKDIRPHIKIQGHETGSFLSGGGTFDQCLGSVLAQHHEEFRQIMICRGYFGIENHFLRDFDLLASSL